MIIVKQLVTYLLCVKKIKLACFLKENGEQECRFMAFSSAFSFEEKFIVSLIAINKKKNIKPTDVMWKSLKPARAQQLIPSFISPAVSTP